jgi:hypothetical protein
MLPADRHVHSAGFWGYNQAFHIMLTFPLITLLTINVAFGYKNNADVSFLKTQKETT